MGTLRFPLHGFTQVLNCPHLSIYEKKLMHFCFLNPPSKPVNINERLVHASYTRSVKSSVYAPPLLLWQLKVNSSTLHLISQQQARNCVAPSRVSKNKRHLWQACLWRLVVQWCRWTAKGPSLPVHRENKRMTCDHLSRLVALYLMFCATGAPSFVESSPNFGKKGRITF